LSCVAINGPLVSPVDCVANKTLGDLSGYSFDQVEAHSNNRDTIIIQRQTGIDSELYNHKKTMRCTPCHLNAFINYSQSLICSFLNMQLHCNICCI